MWEVVLGRVQGTRSETSVQHVALFVVVARRVPVSRAVLLWLSELLPLNPIRPCTSPLSLPSGLVPSHLDRKPTRAVLMAGDPPSSSSHLTLVESVQLCTQIRQSIHRRFNEDLRQRGVKGEKRWVASSDPQTIPPKLFSGAKTRQVFARDATGHWTLGGQRVLLIGDVVDAVCDHLERCFDHQKPSWDLIGKAKLWTKLQGQPGAIRLDVHWLHDAYADERQRTWRLYEATAQQRYLVHDAPKTKIALTRFERQAAVSPKQQWIHHYSPLATYILKNGSRASAVAGDYKLVDVGQLQQELATGTMDRVMVYRDREFLNGESWSQGLTTIQVIREAAENGKTVDVQDLERPFNANDIDSTPLVTTMKAEKLRDLWADDRLLNCLSLKGTMTITPRPIRSQCQTLPRILQQAKDFFVADKWTGNSVGKPTVGHRVPIEMQSCLEFDIHGKPGVFSPWHVDNCGYLTFATLRSSESTQENDASTNDPIRISSQDSWYSYKKDEDTIKLWAFLRTDGLDTPALNKLREDFGSCDGQLLVLVNLTLHVLETDQRSTQVHATTKSHQDPRLDQGRHYYHAPRYHSCSHHHHRLSILWWHGHARSSSEPHPVCLVRNHQRSVDDQRTGSQSSTLCRRSVV